MKSASFIMYEIKKKDKHMEFVLLIEVVYGYVGFFVIILEKGYS